MLTERISCKGLICLIVVISCPVMASAAWVPLTGDPVSIASLANTSLIIEDKEFSEFELFGIGAGGAIGPDPTSVFVQGGWDDQTGDYGLRFLLSWNAGVGQTVNANLNFKVSILPGYDAYFIKDVLAILSGASATGTGVVNASEIVWDGPIPGGSVLASLSLSKQELDNGQYLTASAEFSPVKEIWVRKDISITGGTGINDQQVDIGGTAHLSEMFQFFSQIPEPTTLCLLALGLGMLKRRRR